MVSLVRAALLVLCLLPFPGAAWAQEVNEPAVQEKVRAIITAQVEAFRKDDNARAFSFASPMIQQQFRSPDVFAKMVQGSYTAVYRPRSFDFRRLLKIDGIYYQEVAFVGAELQTLLCIYQMMEMPDGSWRINGVFAGQGKEQAT